MDQKRTPSQAQIDANHRNAQNSTGPRTTAGKSASSRNRLTHGLRSDKHILLDEDPEGFLLLLDAVFSRHHPVGDSEVRMVERITHLEWRISRSVAMEEGIIRNRLGDVAKMDHDKNLRREMQRADHAAKPKIVAPPPDPPLDGDRLARVFYLDSRGDDTIGKFQRYEVNIERSLQRTVRLLQTMQKIRESNPPDPDPEPEIAPAPAPIPEDIVVCRTKPKNGGMVEAPSFTPAAEDAEMTPESRTWEADALGNVVAPHSDEHS